jgi:hypothetical protein
VVATRQGFYAGDFRHPGGQEEYTAVLARTRGQIAALEEERRALRAAAQEAAQGQGLPPLTEVAARVGSWTGALAGADVAAQREVLAELVVRVLPRRIAYGKYLGEITWTPFGERLGALAAASRALPAA